MTSFPKLTYDALTVERRERSTTYGAPKTAHALSNATRAGVVSLGNQTAEP